MEMTILLDPTDPMGEIAPLARAPYTGCLSIAAVAHVIVCAMPRFIELDEISRPLSPVSVVQFTWPDSSDEPDAPDFEPPLLAAGRFTTVARRGTLPPLEWDD